MDFPRALAAHQLVALDTPVLIYALEQHVRFGPPARLVLEAVAAGDVAADASTLLLAELLVVPYDVEAAVRAYDDMRAEHPELVELLARNLRTGRSYFGRCVRAIRDVPSGDFLSAVRAWLAANP